MPLPLRSAIYSQKGNCNAIDLNGRPFRPVQGRLQRRAFVPIPTQLDKICSNTSYLAGQPTSSNGLLPLLMHKHDCISSLFRSARTTRATFFALIRLWSYALKSADRESSPWISCSHSATVFFPACTLFLVASRLSSLFFIMSSSRVPCVYRTRFLSLLLASPSSTTCTVFHMFGIVDTPACGNVMISKIHE